MSKFGMKIGDETVYGVVTPDQALDLIQKVVNQYFGEYWTQHKPRCPLCDEALSDTEKHMNRPVGECTNPKCDSTIHISDFFGKVKDVLEEWDQVKEDWKANMKKEISKKSSHIGFEHTPTSSVSNIGGPVLTDDDDVVLTIDDTTVFVW
jgi:hypothetical protein